MNIQIFGKKKCFDTKKAERWFKERRIKFQQIDLVRFGMSGGEFDSVLRAVGGVDALIDWSVKSPEIDLMRYTDDRTSSSSASPLCATADRPPPDTARRCGRRGNKHKVGGARLRSAVFAYFFFSPPARSNIALLRRAK